MHKTITLKNHRPSDEKIAGHETDILIISPKFEGKPNKAYILCPRKRNYLTSRRPLDAEGILRDMFVYTRISFDPETVKHKWKAFEKEI